MKQILNFLSIFFTSKKMTNGAHEIPEVNIPLNENWVEYDSKKTIGNKGSEGGTIIFDCENLNGARITLESQCGNIPFAITFGIYSLMFHTEFLGNLSASKNYIIETQNTIDKIFLLLDVSEDDRTVEWDKEYADLYYNLAYK